MPRKQTETSRQIRDDMQGALEREFSRAGLTFKSGPGKVDLTGSVDMEKAKQPGAYTTRPGGEVKINPENPSAKRAAKKKKE